MPKPSEGTTPALEELRDKILAERAAGNVVFWGLPGELMSAPLDDFVKQPADGMLYDLNRLEEISLTFLKDPKWVNDFAVALVIRKLVKQRDTATKELSAAQAKLMELAKLYHDAPGLPLEAPGAELEKWTSILCGFGYVLNEELQTLAEGERHE